MEIKVEFADAVVENWGLNERKIKEAVALLLYHRGEITMGAAANIIGCTKMEFDGLMRENRIHFNLNPCSKWPTPLPPDASICEMCGFWVGFETWVSIRIAVAFWRAGAWSLYLLRWTRCTGHPTVRKVAVPIHAIAALFIIFIVIQQFDNRLLPNQAS